VLRQTCDVEDEIACSLAENIATRYSSGQAADPQTVALRINEIGALCTLDNISAKNMFSLFYEQADGTRRFLQSALNEADALTTAINLSRSALVVIVVIEEENDIQRVRYRLERGVPVQAPQTERKAGL